MTGAFDPQAAPAARVVWSRLREVELHHVDLGTGYGPADWPEPFTLHMITSLAKDFAGREDGPRALLRSPEVGHDVPLGANSPMITGPARSVVAQVHAAEPMNGWMLNAQEPPSGVKLGAAPFSASNVPL